MGAYTDDFLFIHIPKTGGTSVKQWLANHVQGVKLATDEDCGFPIGHIPLRDVKQWVGRCPSSFKRIVAVIRDPYEQQLSQWLFWADRYRRGQWHIHNYTAGISPTLTDFLQDPRSDFHCWYETNFAVLPVGGATPRSLEDPLLRYEGFSGFYRFWLEVDGEIPENVELIRYEHLAESWARIAPEVTGKLDAPSLPQANQGPRRIQYALEYYTPLGVSIVTAKFAWTFAAGLYPEVPAEALIKK